MSHQQSGDSQMSSLSLSSEAVDAISRGLRGLLADVFALYLKTKNFHWHMKGKHFRDYHLLLDEHGEQLFDITDDIAERARKIGGASLRSISDIAKHQTLADNNETTVSPNQMLTELHSDNRSLRNSMLALHRVCEQFEDVATASFIENWIDEAERRAWFLSELVQD